MVTASAFTILVVWTMVSDKGGSSNPDNSASQNSCQQTSVSGSVEQVPEIYKASKDVTKLESTDLKVGTGKAAQPNSCILVKYYGTLAQSGKLFDENYTQPQLLQSPIGAGMLIAGWDQGVIGMKEGGVRRLVIPSDMGYGPSGSGEKIPPDSDLVFTIKLVTVK